MFLKTVTVGPLSVNCYLVGCEQTNAAAVIDPGDDASAILNVVQKNNLDIKYILLTHGHVDHLAHLARIKTETNAQFLMHQEDAFLLKGLFAQALMFGLPNPGNPKPDRFVADGEEINLGELQIKVLHTPGHSPGSITFHVEDKLFVGDLLFAGSIGRTDLPRGHYQTLINSVETRIFTLPDETLIYPGHGPETTVGQEKATNPFF